jgi:hypothetical protein
VNIIALILLVPLGSFSLHAQNNSDPQWWFNVELILFKRTLLPSNNENFGPAIVIQDAEENDANNLLYLAAIQNASIFNSYLSALPLCNANTSVENTFGATVNFEYKANPEVSSTQILDNVQFDPNSADPVQDASVESGQHLNRVLLSTSTILSKLLAPFDMSNFNDQIADPSNVDDADEASTSDQDVILSLTNRVIDINNQLQSIASSSVSLDCVNNEYQPSLSHFALPSIGPRLFNTSSSFMGKKQLLSQSDLVLEDYAQSVFRQRDITPLLYTAWRQQVEFGIENAEFFRVRAGNMLETSQSQTYDQWQKAYSQANNVLIENDDIRFFEILQQNLNNNQSVDWLAQESIVQDTNETAFKLEKQYEIDGKIKVYLDYVNQIPYLHIDSEFNRFSIVLDENGNSELTAFPSKQRRRIISKQIHYFDHPAFGVIVRLERFTPPVADQAITNSNNN